MFIRLDKTPERDEQTDRQPVLLQRSALRAMRLAMRTGRAVKWRINQILQKNHMQCQRKRYLMDI